MKPKASPSERRIANHFLAANSSACQLRMTVIVGDAASPAGATARKRWPVWHDIVGIWRKTT